jgi:hypothetical protein
MKLRLGVIQRKIINCCRAMCDFRVEVDVWTTIDNGRLASKHPPIRMEL